MIDICTCVDNKDDCIDCMKDFIAEIEADILIDVNKLCNIICNSPSNTTIKEEIENLAFKIAHHPILLNL